MVERVPHSVRNGLRPFFEGLPGALVAGDVLLRNSVAAHCTPFVMVSVMSVDQPELGDVAELDVLGYLLRHQVAVVVYDWQAFRAAVEQLPGCPVGKHKVFVNELWHSIIKCVYWF